MYVYIYVYLYMYINISIYTDIYIYLYYIYWMINVAQNLLKQTEELYPTNSISFAKLLDGANVGRFGHCRITSRSWIALHQFPVIAHKALPRIIEADPTVPHTIGARSSDLKILHESFELVSTTNFRGFTTARSINKSSHQLLDQS